ncbi:hypothetical protein ACWCXH_33815 [Kitasatospora sp. NPDC001660]
MTSTVGRVLAALAALLVLAVPAATPATAAPPAAPVASSVVAAPAYGPKLAPTWDIWGTVCGTIALPVFGAGGGALCEAGKVAAPEIKKEVSAALQSTIIKPMADGMREFTAQVLRVGLTWWLTTPSVQVSNSGVTSSQTGTDSSGATVTYSLQGICAGVGEVIAVILLMFQGIRTMIQRKGKPLVEALQGLLVNALVGVIGIAVIDALLVASDALTTTIINVSFHGNDKLPERVLAMLLPQAGNPIGLMTMAVIVLIIGLIQFCLLFLRQASIPIQALLLPIAGAGQVGGEKSRQWLPRLYTSIFAVIAYKPLAALIISAGFVEIANGNETVDWIRGIVTLLLSVIALKSLMGLFAPLGMSMAGATAGGFAGALAGAASFSELAGGKSGDGGRSETSAVQQASNMSQQGGTNPAAAANPTAAAVQAGVGVVNQAKQNAGNAVSGADNPAAGVPKQSTGSGQGGKSAGGQDGESGRAGNGQSGKSGQNGESRPAGGSGQNGPGQGTTPAPAGPSSSGGPGIAVSFRAAEAGARGIQQVGNTVSEGSTEQ